MDISVGIYSRKEIPVEFHGNFIGSDGNIYTGFHTIKEPGMFTPQTENAYFELKEVMIGIQFHWQRTENQSFKGSLNVIYDTGGVLTAINTLDIEEYLYSVISSEMSGTSLLELLKAHAIISRSWAVKKVLDRKKLIESKTSVKSTDVTIDSENRHIAWYGAEPHLLFDVCADDHCQRYQGFTRSLHPQVIEAVDSTRSMVLMYEGEICDCRYHKCCGGRTERYSVCWEDRDFPYLSSVEDEYCGRASEDVLRQMLNNYDFETKDYHDWSVHYSAAEISEIVRRRSGIDFGTITDITPLKRGDSGRIYELQITGTQRSMVIGKELEIRKFLSNNHLYSSAFDVEKSADGGFTLNGKGWGHGVGLCQIGAAVMASEGKKFDEILKKYYFNFQLKINYNILTTS